jgi:hypothetical protein
MTFILRIFDNMHAFKLLKHSSLNFTNVQKWLRIKYILRLLTAAATTVRCRVLSVSETISEFKKENVTKDLVW